MRAKGLTQKEAEKRIRERGYNEIKELIPVSPLKILLNQIRQNVIIYFLFAAMLISFGVGKFITGYAIVAVILIVISVGFVQEHRAERAIKALKQMIVPVSIVIRDGKEQEILSREIVPGDVIVLRSGEKVPADCIILEKKQLRVNEAVLTGESKEISKFSARGKRVSKEENILFMGSFIINGRCTAQVIHTGMETKFGSIAGMISMAEKELPLQTKVNAIAQYISVIAIFVSILTGIVMLFRGLPLSIDLLVEVLIVVLALSVSAFPEGFPVVLITTLASGAHRMAKKNAIVNRMSILETLGETTVICADKTGTITKGEMTVKKIYFDGSETDVSGSGFEIKGQFYRDGKELSVRDSSLRLLLKTAVLCNDAKIERTGEDEIYHALGTSTETALLIMAAKGKLFKEDLNGARMEEIPFSSEQKLMYVWAREKEGDYIYAKGAPEVLLKNCQFYYKDGKILLLHELERRAFLTANKKFTKASYRTLALAYQKKNVHEKDIFSRHLIFLGLVGMEDPPREEVKDSLKLCKTAGINVKMITGDDKTTALSIAQQIGLKGQVIEGEDLDKLTDEELTRVVAKVTIFARVRPEHKLRIVKALKQNKEIVTMTGDGVNDAPALREAHIGVAMGKSGTDVSREAADLTLKDDNFATIVSAIGEGRTIFHNIRKFLTYQLSCNYAELMIIFLGVLIGLPLPLLALQILFMNLVTDDLPALTLGLNPPSRDVMNMKPRKKSNLLNKHLIILLVLAGSVIGLITLGVFYFTLNVLDQELAVARTVALVTLIFFEIANAFNFRSFRFGVHELPLFTNRYLVYASLISLLATVLIVYTPLNLVFETTPISLWYWLMALVVSLSVILIFDLLKIMTRKRGGLLPNNE